MKMEIKPNKNGYCQEACPQFDSALRHRCGHCAVHLCEPCPEYWRRKGAAEAENKIIAMIKTKKPTQRGEFSNNFTAGIIAEQIEIISMIGCGDHDKDGQ